jgi:hypothetical protein
VGERWRRSFERLRTSEDLSRWFVQAGMAERPPAVEPAQLEATRALRDAMYPSPSSPDRAASTPRM